MAAVGPAVELSLLAVHPKLLALPAALLHTDADDLRLYSAEAWAKYTGAADYEVELFVWLSDVTIERGGWGV